MTTILAHIKVKPGEEARFEKIVSTLFAATHADEPRMRAYDYWRGAEPRTYYTLLSFDDYAGFLEHQTSPHHETAGPQIATVVESVRLEWVDAVAGASTFSPTNHQTPSSGADELTKRYADRYAAQVADWWLALRGQDS